MTGIRTEVLLDRARSGSLADRSAVQLLWTLTTARWTGQLTLSPESGTPVIVDVRDGEFGTLRAEASPRDELLAVMGWADGSYVLDEELSDEDRELQSFGPPLDLIFEGLEAYGDVSNLVQRIKSRLTLYPVATQDTEWRLRALAHPQPLSDLVEVCRGQERLATAMRHEHPDMGAKLKALFYAVETHLLYPSPQPLPGQVELVYTNLRGFQDGPAPEVDRRRSTRTPASLIVVEPTEPTQTTSGEFAVIDDAVALPLDPAPSSTPLETSRPEPAPGLSASSLGTTSSSRRLARPASGIRKARRIKTQTELRDTRKVQAAQAEQAAQQRESAKKVSPSAPPASGRPKTGTFARPGRRPSRSSTPARPGRAKTPARPAPAPRKRQGSVDSVAAQTSYSRGLKFMDAGDWAKALTEFSRATQQNPAELYYHAAVLWSSYKNVPSKAATILDKLSALYDGVSDEGFDPERARAEIKACTARVLRDEEAIDEAIAAYEVALEHQPSWLDVKRELDALKGNDDTGEEKKKAGLFSRLGIRR